MITWLVVKKFVKKAWVFLKKYWYVPCLILYTLILTVVLRRKGSITEILEIQNDSYKKQIDAINEAHDQEIQKRDEILRNYKNVIDQLKKQYEDDSQELDNKKKEEVKRIVEKYNGDPDGMAEELAKKFGLEYVNE